MYGRVGNVGYVVCDSENQVQFFKCCAHARLNVSLCTSEVSVKCGVVILGSLWIKVSQ